jgi:very-short-patch-repair endonuclease
VLTSPRLRGEVGLRQCAIRVRGTGGMRGADKSRSNRARRLRKNATDAEGALWRKLRSRSLCGFKFVRQEPIGPYTVDFVCREIRLIVEVDGGQHVNSPHDAVRDRWLASRNYRVMRFWNNDVLTNITGVLEAIANALAEAPPHPDRAGRCSASPGAIRPLPARGER